MTRRGGRLVYSTDDARRGEIDRGGRTGGGKPSGPSLPPEKQLAGIRREKKGRGGKTVTRVRGLPPDELPRWAGDLKRALGCGATVEGDDVVLLGDLVGRAADWLTARGAKQVLRGN